MSPTPSSSTPAKFSGSRTRRRPPRPPASWKPPTDLRKILLPLFQSPQWRRRGRRNAVVVVVVVKAEAPNHHRYKNVECWMVGGVLMCVCVLCVCMCVRMCVCVCVLCVCMCVYAYVLCVRCVCVYVCVCVLRGCRMGEEVFRCL